MEQGRDGTHIGEPYIFGPKDTYEALRDLIKHEDTLISNRIGWLMAGQSILFLAYSSKVAILLDIIPVVGFMIAIVVLLELSRAHMAIQEVDREWERYSGYYPQTKTYYGQTMPIIGKNSARGKSSLFPFVGLLPGVFMASWIVLFLFEKCV